MRAWLDDTPLTDEFAHSLWGVESNWPTGDKEKRNAYLTEAAQELVSQCVVEARDALASLVERANRANEKAGWASA